MRYTGVLFCILLVASVLSLIPGQSSLLVAIGFSMVAVAIFFVDWAKHPLPKVKENPTPVLPQEPRDYSSLMLFGELCLGGMITAVLIFWLVKNGIISSGEVQAVSWVLVLPTIFIIHTVHTLITGKEPKIGNTKYTLSKNASTLILGLLFALLGFLLWGLNGVILGISISFGIISVIEYYQRRVKNRKT